jgi:hypothetical protein
LHFRPTFSGTKFTILYDKPHFLFEIHLTVLSSFTDARLITGNESDCQEVIAIIGSKTKNRQFFLAKTLPIIRKSPLFFARVWVESIV